MNIIQNDIIKILKIINPVEKEHPSLSDAAKILGWSERKLGTRWVWFQRKFPIEYKRFKEFQKTCREPYQGINFKPDLLGDRDLAEDEIAYKW